MKKLIVIIILLLATKPALANSNNEDVDVIYGFLQGSYVLVGKAPDSNNTYYGKVHLEKTEDGLHVIREVNGIAMQGEGTIETATADNIKVLRVRFVEGEKKYEATYLIHSDLDNYGRLTGYLYLKEGATETPGVEALFYDHGINR